MPISPSRAGSAIPCLQQEFAPHFRLRTRNVKTCKLRRIWAACCRPRSAMSSGWQKCGARQPTLRRCTTFSRTRWEAYAAVGAPGMHAPSWTRK